MARRGLYSGVGITYPEWTSFPGGETEAGEAECLDYITGRRIS